MSSASELPADALAGLLDRLGRGGVGEAQIAFAVDAEAGAADHRHPGPIEQLVPEALRARHHAWREALRAPTGARTMGEGREVHGVRRDGTLVPIEVGLTPLRSPDGDFMLSSIADVSERRAERDRAFLLELAELARAFPDSKYVARGAALGCP